MENQNNELMNKEKTSNKGVIILSVICVILAVLCVLFALDIIELNKQEQPNNDVVENNKCPEVKECETTCDCNNDTTDTTDETETTDTTDEIKLTETQKNIIKKLKGYWESKEEETYVYINENFYFQMSFIYGTDFGFSGPISDVEVLSENKYKISVFIKGCKGEDCMDEREDETIYFEFTLNETKKTLTSENSVYKYIRENKNE